MLSAREEPRAIEVFFVRHAQNPSMLEEVHAGAARLGVSSWRGPSYGRLERQVSHREMRCLPGLVVVNALQSQAETGEDRWNCDERNGQKECARPGRVTPPKAC